MVEETFSGFLRSASVAFGFLGFGRNDRGKRSVTARLKARALTRTTFFLITDKG